MHQNPHAVTVWVRTEEVLVAYLLSPLYTEVMVWVPTLSDEVVYVAVPRAMFTVPRVFVPSLNVTDPVAALGVTVAVKVTRRPETDGFREDLRAVWSGPWSPSG